ncbi:MAG: hypothetical protein H0T42_15485 [Deltaproteobacteria bacterium]|nr:hypothetical protein [Deltaproteobacteria bacterium]
MTTTLDDARLLPAFFAHLRDHVDAFVVLDLGSSDDTLEVLGREPLVAATLRADGAPADGGRRMLVERARELGAHWILWLDPDERLEAAFVELLASHLESATREGRTVLGVWARMLDESGARFVAHGSYGLDHKYILFATDQATSEPPEAAPAALRRLTEFSAYRLHSASASAAWRRLGVYARCRPDPDMLDFQAQPPRTRAIEAARAYHGSPVRAGGAAEPDRNAHAIERLFAACACEDWDVLTTLSAGRQIEIASDLEVAPGDLTAAMRAWWKQWEKFRSFASSEPIFGDQLSLVLYRGERRAIMPLSSCHVTSDHQGVTAVKLTAFPPQWRMYDQLLKGSHDLALAERAATSAAVPRPDVLLSVIMPFYKRLADFERVLPLNARYLERGDLEVVLSMDEPTEEEGVLALVRRFPSIRWTVLINDHDHPWRTPTRAINVGLRHAVGRYILVVSPESAYVTDVPGYAEQLLRCGTGIAAVGRVAFATFPELEARGSLDACYRALAPFTHALHPALRPGNPYGSLCAERERLVRIGGYDEQLELYGGDDDDVRARLQLDGTIIGVCEEMQILHLSGPRPPLRVRRGLREIQRIFEPSSALANPDGWGHSYDRVAQSWR